jgi:hypothetical protein
MNYQKIYDQIIERAKNRELVGYKERHHIVPKCIGGSDDSNNLVYLTAREHFLCHWLLHELYPSNRGLSLAFSMMCNVENNLQARYIPSSRIVEYSKRVANENSKGWKHTNEAREKISLAGKGNKYNLGKKQSEETKKKRSSSLKGRIMTDEHKQKLKKAANSIKDRPWLLKENRDQEKEKLRHKKISEKRKGIVFTEEHKRKLSEAKLKNKNNSNQ